MKNFLADDNDYTLWNLLATTRHALFRVRQQELRQFGISPRQSAIMLIIQSIREKATPAAITRWTFRKSHTVSELISRMEKQGLLKKTKDLDRKNQVRVELTEKGLKAYEQAKERESIHLVMSTLTDAEKEQLKTILEKLRQKALQELGIDTESLLLTLTS